MLSVQILYHYAPGDAEVNIIVSLSASLLLYSHVMDRFDMCVCGKVYGRPMALRGHANYCVVALKFT